MLSTETKLNVKGCNYDIPELAHIRVRSLVHWEAKPNFLVVHKLTEAATRGILYKMVFLNFANFARKHM